MKVQFIQLTNSRKPYKIELTKANEISITGVTAEDKTKSNTLLVSKKEKESSYLKGITTYLKKKKSIKYNTLPYEFGLMKLDNFITGKYCRALAVFKEKLIYYYDEEFLKEFYKLNESKNKIPLFSGFYRSYLKFFCSPTLADLKINDLLEKMIEKKAKAYYNENYKNEDNMKNNNITILPTIIFTNKIKKDLSCQTNLTNLSKTTIPNNSLINKSSINSLTSLNKFLEEIESKKKIITQKNNSRVNTITNENSTNNLNKLINSKIVSESNVKTSSTSTLRKKSIEKIASKSKEKNINLSYHLKNEKSNRVKKISVAKKNIFINKTNSGVNKLFKKKKNKNKGILNSPTLTLKYNNTVKDITNFTTDFNKRINKIKTYEKIDLSKIKPLSRNYENTRKSENDRKKSNNKNPNTIKSTYNLKNHCSVSPNESSSINTLTDLKIRSKKILRIPNNNKGNTSLGQKTKEKLRTNEYKTNFSLNVLKKIPKDYRTIKVVSPKKKIVDLSGNLFSFKGSYKKSCSKTKVLKTIESNKKSNYLINNINRLCKKQDYISIENKYKFSRVNSKKKIS